MTDELRGQPFIEKIQRYTNLDDAAFGESIERLCGNCFYRNFRHNPNEDCHIVGDLAKITFGFNPEEFLPPQIDEKEVGNYCPHFVNYQAE